LLFNHPQWYFTAGCAQVNNQWLSVIDGQEDRIVSRLLITSGMATTHAQRLIGLVCDAWSSPLPALLQPKILAPTAGPPSARPLCRFPTNDRTPAASRLERLKLHTAQLDQVSLGRPRQLPSFAGGIRRKRATTTAQLPVEQMSSSFEFGSVFGLYAER
jgi:hypothetical protein